MDGAQRFRSGARIKVIKALLFVIFNPTTMSGSITYSENQLLL
jgi:hypothetical protein